MKDIAIEIKTNSMDRLNDRLDAFEREFYELEKYMFINLLSMRTELFLICYWNSFVMDTVEGYHE